MTLCGLLIGSQSGVRDLIVIAELQFLPHMNRSYVYRIIFWLSVFNLIPYHRSSKTCMWTVALKKV